LKKFLSLLILSLFFISLLTTTHIDAAIDYTEWKDRPVSKLIQEARRNEQMILVVVTQPDWCPPCIRMDNDIVNNPDEMEFSNLAKNWINLEVLGYDESGAQFLSEQNIRFHGTPTTMLLDPSKIPDPVKAKKAKLTTSGLVLGDLKVVHSLAAFPDDFTRQFQNAVNGFDLVAAAQADMRKAQSIESYEKLAAAYTDQGSVKQANRVYSSLFFRDDLTLEKRQELEWTQISDVTQRVAKDHPLTLEQIETFNQRYPEYTKVRDNYEDMAYKKAWSLVAVGKVKEAKELMHKAYVNPQEDGKQDVGNIRTYLYFAFRNPDALLIKDAQGFKQVADVCYVV